MAEQLVLIDPSEVAWHLDDKTKEVGRQGLAEARRALHAAGQRRGRPPTRPRAA